MAGRRRLLLLVGLLALLSQQAYGSMLDELIDKVLPEEEKNATKTDTPAKTTEENTAEDTDDGGDDDEDAEETEEEKKKEEEAAAAEAKKKEEEEAAAEAKKKEEEEAAAKAKREEIIAKAKQNIEALKNIEELTLEQSATLKGWVEKVADLLDEQEDIEKEVEETKEE